MKKAKKQKQKKARWWKRISLRGALVLTTLICLLGGLCACLVEVSLLSGLNTAIYQKYVSAYLPDEGEAYIYRENGLYIRLEKELPQFYEDPETGERFSMEFTSPSQFIPQGFSRFFWEHNGLIQLIAVFLTAGVFFFLDAAWFYRWKLRQPLAVLNEAAEKIGKNDLDFHIVSQSSDELGRLCSSFESMRCSLEENNRAMWRAMEERRRLNAAFAHDLRTPLTVLQGYSDYLLEGLPTEKVSPEKAEETVSTMKRSLTRLEQYVEGMNSVQKLEDIELERQETRFDELCGQLADTAKILRGQEALIFEKTGQGRVYADKEILFRVFENLMSNAGRYAKELVGVHIALDASTLSLTVWDDGSGFPPEALKKAAEPYYRGESSKNAPLSGSAAADPHFGLGLYICRVLCEKHGGALTLRNRPEGGGSVTASFSVTEKT